MPIRPEPRRFSSFFSPFFPTFLFRRRYNTIPVTEIFQTVPILTQFSLSKLCNFRSFKEAVKNSVLQCSGTFKQRGKVTQDKKPLVKHTLQLILSLIEFRHFEVNEGKFIIEHLVRVKVHKFHLMMKILLIRSVKREIQDTHHINSLQLIIPFTPFSLLTNRESGIKDTAVLEELLFTTLHLNQELLSLLILTIYIKYGPTVIFLCSKMLCIKVSYILDYFLLE